MRFLGILCVLMVALCLAPGTSAQTNYWWTNATDSAWSTSGNWTNEAGPGGPASGGATNYIVNFANGGFTYNATSDLGVGGYGFLLNRLIFNNDAVTIGGNNLVFTSNGATLPQLQQNGSSNVIINAGLILAANTTFAGTGTGGVTANAGVIGTGQLIMTGTNYTLALNGNNSYTGATTVNAGTLAFGGSGNSTIGAITVANGTLALTSNATVYVGNNAVTIGNAASDVGTMTLSGNATWSSILPSQNVLSPALTIGNSGKGVMVIQDNASITNKLYLGVNAGSAGAVYQRGGIMLNWGGQGNDGRIGASGYGYYELTSGVLSNMGFTQLGVNAGGVGVLAQYGGTFLQGTVYGGQLGVARAGTGVVYLAGGNFISGPQLNIGDGSGAASGYAVFTVATNATVTINNNVSMDNVAGQTAILNLNGGVLQANQITKAQAASLALVNFNGGTFLARTAGNMFNTGANAPNAVNIYSGGAIIDSTNLNVTIPVALLAPTGSGVTSIAISPLGGYIGSPFVQITGGGGTGATAFAQFDSISGTVTGIVITSAGYGYTGDATVTLVGGGAATTNLGVIAVVSNNVSGGLTKLGTGMLTLTGTNTYTGGTVFNAGTISIGSFSNLPAGALAFNGGILQITGTAISNLNPYAITLGANGGGFDVVTTYLTVTNAITGTGGLTKFGTSTLVLAGSNTYTGATIMNGGSISTLILSNPAGQAISSTNVIVIGGGDTRLRLGANQQMAPYTVLTLTNNNAKFELNGSTQTVAVIANSGPGLTQIIQNSEAGGTGTGLLIVSNDTVNSIFGTSPTLGNGYIRNMTGTLALNKAGAATLTLVGGNIAYSGPTVISGGTLVLSNATTFASTTVANNGALTFWLDTGNFTYTNAISGSGSLTKSGGGTLTLNAVANTFTNGTTITGGTVVITTDSALGAIPATPKTNITFSNTGTLLVNAAINLNSNRTILITSSSTGIVDTAGNTTTYAGSITGPGTLGKAGTGILVLTNFNNSYTGGTIINAGTIRLGTTNALGNPTGPVLATINPGGVLDLYSFRLDAQYTNVILLGSYGTAANVGGIANTGAADLTNVGVKNVTLTSSSAIGQDTRRADITSVFNGGGYYLSKIGNGQNFLNGTVSNFAGMFVNAGTLGSLNVNNQGLPTVQINAAGTFRIFGGNRILTNNWVLNGGSINVDGGSATLNGPIFLLAPTNGFALVSNLTVNAAITGPGGLLMAGPSGLILSGTNTYTGGTIINGGTLQFSAAVATPSTGLIAINTGGGLIVTGAYTTVNGWVTDGRLATTSAGSLLLVGNDASSVNMTSYPNLFIGAAAGKTVTFGGTITPGTNGYFLGGGGGTLVVNNEQTAAGAAATFGAGTVILASNLNVTGTATINSGGALQLGNGLGAGWFSPTSIVNNGTVIYNRSDAMTAPIPITGSGALTVANGTLTLAGTTTLSGNVVVGSLATSRSILIFQNNASAAKLLVGNASNSVGAVIQNGGSISISPATANVDVLSLGINSGYGYYQMNGGTLTVGQLGAGGGTGNGNVGVFDQNGGVVNVVTGWLLAGGWNANSKGAINLYGGTMSGPTGNAVALNALGNQGAYGIINMLGSGAVLIATNNANGLSIMSGANNSNGVFNLNAGTLLAVKVSQLAAGNAQFNFNGGTLQAVPNTTNATFFSLNTGGAAYIYGNGGTIDTANSTITIAQSLRAPTGSGVTSITLSNNGAGYIGTPFIYITGGSGVGATAVAQVDFSTGQITNILVTSAGVGYQETDVLAVNLVGGGATTAATISNITFASNTSGALTKQGIGTLILTGTNDYSGGTIINAGVLQFNSTAARPGSGLIVVNTNGAVAFNYTGAQYQYDITWTLDKGSTGAIALLATNTNENVDFAAAGLSNAFLGAAVSLTYGGTYTPFSNDIRLGGGGAVLTYTNDIGSGTNITIGGAPGSVVVLTGANANDLSVTVQGGALRATEGVGLSTNANLVLTGGVLEMGGTFNRAVGTNANEVQIFGGGFSAYNAPLTVNLGNAGKTQTWGNADFNPTALVLNEITANTNLTFVNSLNLGGADRAINVNANIATITGNILGTGGLAKGGAGTLVLAATNTYSGATAINAGTLQMSAPRVLPSATAVTVANSAIFDLNSQAQTIGSLAGAGNVALGAATLTVGDGNSTAFGGVISGSGGLTKTGTGTLMLTNLNFYTGPTTINAGTLKLAPTVAGPSFAGLSEVYTNSGTAIYLGNNPMAQISAVSSARWSYVYLNGGTASAPVWNGLNGLWPTTATIAYQGYVYNTTGSNVTWTFAAGNFDDNSQLSIDGVVQANNGQRNYTLTPGAHTIDYRIFNNAGPGGPYTYDGLTGGIPGSGGFGLRYDPLGRNTNVYTAFLVPTDSGNGAFFSTGLNILPSATAVTIANGATLDLNGAGQLVASLSGDFGSAITNSAAAPAWLTVNLLGTNATFNGNIADNGPTNAIGLGLQGTGTQTLGGTNTYSGGTLVIGGLLKFAATNALPGVGYVTIASGGAVAFDWAGIQSTVDGHVSNISAGAFALTATNASENLNFTGYTNLFLGAAENVTYTGTFTPVGTTNLYSAVNTNVYRLGGGPGLLTFNSALVNPLSLTIGGSVALSTSNTIAGFLTVNNGAILDVNGNDQRAAAIVANGMITNTSGTVATLTAGQDAVGSVHPLNTPQWTNTASIGGAINLVKIGSGMQTLATTNTYTGTTTINGGTLSLNFGIATVTNNILPNTGLNLGGGTFMLTGRTGVTNSQTVGNVTIANGANAIQLTSATGGGVNLAMGTLTRNPYSVVNFTLPGTGAVTTASTAINNGIIGPWATVGTSDWATTNAANQIVAYASYVNDAWGAGNNTTVTANNNITNATTYSLRFADGTARTLTLFGTNVIQSGGILFANASGQNSNLGGTGAVTSATGELLVIDNHTTKDRKNDQTSYIDARIVDYGATNVAVTFASTATSSLNLLSQTSSSQGETRLTATNTYSGGTYLAAGAVYINGDFNFGLSNAPITVLSGYNAIRANSAITLNASRSIILSNNAVLMLSGNAGSLSSGALTVNGVISGNGYIVSAPQLDSLLWLTGSNTWSGILEVQGNVRAQDGIGLSPNANLKLGDGNQRGMLESFGTFTRPLGAGAGQVQWNANNSYNGAQNNGGFAAVGGSLTVNLGNAGAPVTWNTNAGAIGQFVYGQLCLQDINSGFPLYWMNPIDMANGTRVITVMNNLYSNAPAIIPVPLFNGGINKAYGGLLWLTGTNNLNIIQITGGVLRGDFGVGIPTNANISITGGALETDGVIANSLGNQAGQIQLPSGTSGFSAFGAPLTVNLGNGTTIVWQANTYFNPSALLLQEVTANTGLTFAANIDLAGGNRTITVNNTNANLAPVITGTISSTGNGTLTKSGAGLLVLSNVNTYGNTVISAGTLRAELGVGLPTSGLLTLNGGVWETANNVTLGAGTNDGNIALTGGTSGFNAINNPITINLGGSGATLLWGTNYFNPSTLVFNNNLTPNQTNITFANSLDFNGANRSINVNAGTVTLTGVLTNSTATAMTLSKTGLGTLVLGGGSNVYLGNLYVNGLGTVVVNSPLNLAGQNFYVGPATGDRATAYINTNVTINLMQAGIGANNVTGTIYMTGGNLIATSGVRLGDYAPGVGVMFQSGGSITSGGEFDVGYNNIACYGFYQMSGGSLTNNGWIQAGRYGIGMIYQNAGTIVSTLNGIIIGGGVNVSTGVIYQTGGAIGGTLPIYMTYANNASRNEFTIADSGVVNIANDLLLNRSTTSATNIVNVNSGGLLAVNHLYKQTANGLAIVNFNGGTFKANTSGTLMGTGAGGSGPVDAAYIWGNGVTIDTANNNVTIAQSLLAPSGSGLTSITITGATGYVGAPYVAISGGGGSNATAVALIDANGTVTNIVITSPGQGYTSTPTIALVNGGGTPGALSSATIGANSTNGALTKSGTGLLILSGTNSYGGGTTINNGNLQFALTNAIPAPNSVTINSGGALVNAGAYTNVVDWINSGYLVASSSGAIALTTNNNVGETINMGSYATLSLGAALGHTVVFTGVLNPAGSTYYIGGGGGTITFANTNALTGANNVIVGNGGGGTVILTGTNDYNGGTLINAGTLQVGNSNAVAWFGTTGAVTNNGTALVFNNTDSATIGQVISGSGSLVKNGGGTITLTAPNTYSGATFLTNGFLVASNNYALGSGSLTVGGTNALLARFMVGDGITVSNAITMNVALGVAGFGEIQGPATGTGTLTGSILINSGPTAGGHFAGGGGTLVLAGYITATNGGFTARAGNEVFSGGGNYPVLNIAQDYVMLGANNGISTSAVVTVAGSATASFDMAGYNQQLAGLVNGAFTATVTNRGSTLSTLTLNNTTANTYSGVLGGNLSLVLAGSSSVTLSGTNTHFGDTLVQSGTLVLSNRFALQSSTLNYTGGSVQFGLGIGAVTLGGLAGSADLALTNSGSGIAVTVGDNGFDTIYTGMLSGSGSLTKIGAGNQVLTGTNIYTGLTTINSGTLTINGQLLNSAVTANTGGALAGNGFIAGTVTINNGATLSPGTSVGTLTVGNLTLTNGVSLNFELGATNASDKVVVNNVLSLDGMNTNWFVLSAVGGFGAGEYTLFDAASIVGSLGSETNFASIGGYTGYLWLDTSANDVKLTVVPEPGTGTLVAVGLLTMLLIRRRRAQS